jgi:hypothetical protein
MPVKTGTPSRLMIMSEMPRSSLQMVEITLLLAWLREHAERG